MVERAQEIFEKYITEEAKRRFYIINCNLGNTNFGEVKETRTKLKIGMKKEDQNDAEVSFSFDLKVQQDKLLSRDELLEIVIKHSIIGLEKSTGLEIKNI